MKGAEIRLVEYMEGSKKRFVIPVYQRNYDWRRLAEFHAEWSKKIYDVFVPLVIGMV